MDNKMRQTNKCVLTLLLFLNLFLLGSSSGVAQAKSERGLLGLTVDRSVAVRLFFQPPDADFSRPALIFRVAGENDPNLNSAPIDRQGRSAYISPDEMKALLRLLNSTGIPWHISNEQEEILPFMKLAQPTKEMTVTVFAANGTASASVPSKNLCVILGKLDSAIKTPRASWEFAFFRRMYRCKVPKFDVDAYPDHY